MKKGDHNHVSRLLARMLDWPDGMPPLNEPGFGSGVFAVAERAGLIAATGTDRLGEERFAPTTAGAQFLQRVLSR